MRTIADRLVDPREIESPAGCRCCGGAAGSTETTFQCRRDRLALGLQVSLRRRRFVEMRQIPISGFGTCRVWTDDELTTGGGSVNV